MILVNMSKDYNQLSETDILDAIFKTSLYR